MSLSIELVHKIFFHVARRADLAVLRLTSQMMNTISTPYYFATVPIFPDWDEDSKPDPQFRQYYQHRKAEDIGAQDRHILMQPDCVSVLE